MFDISQTFGDPIAEPPPVVELTGDTPDGDAAGLLVGVIEAEGFDYTVSRLPQRHQGAYGLTDYTTRQVTVRAGLSGAQRAKTTAHEDAHVLRHDPDSNDEAASGLDRRQQEVEAEPVAYLVMAGLGVDAGGYSFPYLARWSGGDIERIQTSARRITCCANQIIDTIAAATVTGAGQAA